MQVKVTLKFEGISKGLINLELIFILKICLFAGKENYQIKFTLKMSSIMFYPGYKIPDSGNCPLGKFPFREMSFGELSVGEMFVQGIVRSENSPSGKYPKNKILKSL